MLKRGRGFGGPDGGFCAAADTLSAQVKEGCDFLTRYGKDDWHDLPRLEFANFVECSEAIGGADTFVHPAQPGSHSSPQAHSIGRCRWEREREADRMIGQRQRDLERKKAKNGGL
jgi:hypothetical protein